MNIFGRDLLICDCDEFTRNFMTDNFGMEYDGHTISLEDERPIPPEREIPPYTGFGSEEDSLGSFYSLVPKPPIQNWAHYFENDKKILRFVSQLDTSSPEDRERMFIISYYLADDTIAVYEPPARNSGFMGGTFMERSRSKNPENHEFYTPKDMMVGARMEFRKHFFILIEADEYTLNFMSNKKFPGSDVTAIVEKLKNKFREQSVLIRDTFRRVDEDHSGTLNMHEFKGALKKFNFDVSDQELISIMRKFDPNGDGEIRYDEFCASVLDEDHKGVDHRESGQIMHGTSVYKNPEVERQKSQMAQQAQDDRNAQIEAILERSRKMVANVDCSEAFMEADTKDDGHCSYEAFAALLQRMGLGLSDPEMEIMMEAFYDPDHADQTRPMSIHVLDEALF